MFDLFFLKPAIDFIAGLDEADRQEVRRLLDIIGQNPFHDRRNKFPFPVPPAVVSIYYSGEFWIVYHLAGSFTVRIWNIGRSDDRPLPF